MLTLLGHACFAMGVTLVVFCFGCATGGRDLQRFAYSEPQMGVPFHVVLYAPNRQAADTGAAAAFARIKQLNDILSDYDTDSELSRLSQTGGKGQEVQVGADLWRMLERAQALAGETDGAFDITCGPVVSLWRKARREKKLPPAEKLREARQAVGFEKLRLNRQRHSAELLAPYMRLDLGAIAKGFAADEGLKVLRDRGVSRALVSGAGDMAAGDAPPDKSGWRIQLSDGRDSRATARVYNAINGFQAETNSPREFVLLRNHGLATSGDLFQFVEIDGVRYSHIVDPRTGFGLTNRSLVVVIARDGATADGLSTAVSVLDTEKGLELARRHGAVARIVTPDLAVESPGFRRFREKSWGGGARGNTAD